MNFLPRQNVVIIKEPPAGCCLNLQNYILQETLHGTSIQYETVTLTDNQVYRSSPSLKGGLRMLTEEMEGGEKPLLGDSCGQTFKDKL